MIMDRIHSQIEKCRNGKLLEYQQPLNFCLIVIFFLVLAYRIYACFQVPTTTTDALRNLGYASHALENNFAIYTTKAEDFMPEIWTRYWPKTPYIYPPVTLIFFYIFSIFHLGMFWVKLTLTLIELACSYLFYKWISKVAAILFFCAPVSIWYTSHEGEFEALLTLFLILSTLAVKDKHWHLAGFLLAISIQVKQLGILIAPWMLYEMWREQNSDSFIHVLWKVTQGVALGFVPFLGYYLQKPDLWLLPFSMLSGLKEISDMYAWNLIKKHGLIPIHFRSLITYISLVILLIAFIYARKKVETIVSFLPLASFIFVMKSLQVVREWYFIFSPSFLFCFLQRKTLIYFLLANHLIHGLIFIPTILGNYSDSGISFYLMKESQETIYLMESCMFTCNVKPTPKNSYSGSVLGEVHLQ